MTYFIIIIALIISYYLANNLIKPIDSDPFRNYDDD
jgi:hypothetical protein